MKFESKVCFFFPNLDSPERTERSSSVASSISTPPLSEHEHESDDKLSVASASNKDDDHEETQEPFILCRDIPSKTPPLQSQFDQSVDLLDLFSTPLVPPSHSNTDNNKYVKNLLDDSLSSASSYEQNGADKDSISHSSEQQKERSPSPVDQPLSKSSSSASISTKGKMSKSSKLHLFCFVTIRKSIIFFLARNEFESGMSRDSSIFD